MAAVLGGLPLALVQAAAYIRETGRSLAAYRDLLASRGAELLEGHLRGVAQALGAGVAAVGARSPEAAALLRVLAFLAPSAVAIFAFAGIGASRLALDDAAQLLHQRGFVTRERDDIVAHPLVQLVVREGLDDTRRIEQLRLVLKVLNVQVEAPPEEPGSWAAYAPVSKVGGSRLLAFEANDRELAAALAGDRALLERAGFRSTMAR